MPIDLTQAPEGTGPYRYRRRSHRHRSKSKRPLILAVLIGIGLVALLGGALYLQKPKGVSEVPEIVTQPRVISPITPQGVIQADSVPATSSKELPEDITRARVLSLRRVIGPDKTTHLQIDYEFAKSADTPDKYLIAVSTPAGLKHVCFSPNAARRDVVQLGLVLNQLGSAGPIEVWIETDVTYLRVSNVMTLP